MNINVLGDVTSFGLVDGDQHIRRLAISVFGRGGGLKAVKWDMQEVQPDYPTWPVFVP